MIKLNLLPPQERKALAADKTRRWIIYYGSAILSILLLFAASLGLIWLCINIQLKNLSDNFSSFQTSLQGQDVKAQEAAITKANSYLEEIDKIQKNHKSYSGLLASLASATPAGIRLESLSVENDGSITLNGFAQRRDLILDYKDSLEKLNLFGAIENPLSNLVKQTDINFYFKFALRPGVLMKK